MRSRPMLLRIRDAIVQLLEEDARDNRERWASVPAAIYPELTPGLFTGPAPAIAVDLDGEGDESDARLVGHGRTKHGLTLTLYTNEPGRAQDSIVDLWTDVRRALRSRQKLPNIDDDEAGSLSAVGLFLGHYTLGVSEQGEGVAVIEVVADFYWGTATP